MKKNKIKTVIIVILSLIAITSIAVYQFFYVPKIKKDLQLAKIENSQLVNNVAVLTSKNDTLGYQLHVIEIDRSNIKQSLIAMGQKVEELSAQGVKYKDIISSLHAQIQTSGTASIILHDTILVGKIDTTLCKKFDLWSNSHLTLSNGLLCNNHLDIGDYTYRLNFDATTSKAKRGTLLTMSFDDKKAVLVNGSSFIVPYKRSWYEKWWVSGTIGLIAGIYLEK